MTTRRDATVVTVDLSDMSLTPAQRAAATRERNRRRAAVPPNPLPCGCAAVAPRENAHVRHCPLHAAAAELREALVQLVAHATLDLGVPGHEITVINAAKAIAKSKGWA